MTTMSRRTFLRGAATLGASAVFLHVAGGWRLLNAAAGPEVRQMRLIHTGACL